MPTAPPAETNEARLVDIATAHVRKFGHARTTVVGVAADAGMTHANVYRYFPSKAALLAQLPQFVCRKNFFERFLRL